MTVTLEWDNAKRAANIAKHGVDFSEAARSDLANADTISPINKGERRHRSFGRIGDRLFAMV